jgi:hypothetical protein
MRLLIKMIIVSIVTNQLTETSLASSNMLFNDSDILDEVTPSRGGKSGESNQAVLNHWFGVNPCK